MNNPKHMTTEEIRAEVLALDEGREAGVLDAVDHHRMLQLTGELTERGESVRS